jgi:hypothetical protein
MSETTMPKYISILGKRIQIKQVGLEENHGEYHASPRVIKIDSSCTDKYETLFHESLHAALEISGLRETMQNGQEEAVVRCIENALFPLIKRGIFNGKV